MTSMRVSAVVRGRSSCSILLFLILSLASALFSPTTKAQITCTDTTRHFFPVDIGNSWTYRFDFDTTETVQRTIPDTTVISGITWFTYRYNPQFQVLIREDSLGRIWKYFPPVDRAWIWFDFTLDDGALYWLPADFGGQYLVSVHKCIPCSTNVGSFNNCVQFYFNDPLLVHEDIIYTFAPGLGIVREQHDGWYSYEITSTTLTDVVYEPGAPELFSLLQNYPNPFNPTTSIRYVLPSSGTVVLRIFDILGQEVATPVNGRKEAGEHAVIWEARDVPTGVYFYRLTAGGYTQTRTMILVR